MKGDCSVVYLAVVLSFEFDKSKFLENEARFMANEEQPGGTALPAPAGEDDLPSWIEWLTKTTRGLATLVGTVAALVVAIIGLWHVIVPVPTTGSVCQFPDGWIDYAPQVAISLGTECNDGSGSRGKIVYQGKGSQIPTTSICQFENGWHNYAAISKLRVGASCTDGRGNFGHTVAKGTGNQI